MQWLMIKKNDVEMRLSIHILNKLYLKKNMDPFLVSSQR